jgi:AAA+ ATPase superfamily predicted ATPase
VLVVILPHRNCGAAEVILDRIILLGLMFSRTGPHREGRVDFFGRLAERRVLGEQYSRASSFSVLYGRRRVGKTRLIIESLRGRRSIYFSATESSQPELLRQFLRLLAEHFEEPLLQRAVATSWDEALRMLEDRRRGARLIVVFDEFQWAVAASPDLPSTLQRFWDHAWKRGRFHLVLCGSYLSFMEREVLAARRPLFGRRTAQLVIRPFSALDVLDLYGSAPAAHVLPIYFVFGGIPAYLEHVVPTHSLRENIVRSLLDEGAPLREEPVFLLREELRDFRVHTAILMAIASGATQVQEIALRTGVAETKLGYYLAPLLELGYLERWVSIEKAHLPSSKKSRYRLIDPLLRFHFRFVQPFQSQLEHHGAQVVYRRYIHGTLQAYFGFSFELLVRELLPLYLQARYGALCEALGSYWNRTAQVDVVARRDDGITHLVECRWGVRGPTRADLDALVAKIAVYPEARSDTVVPMIVCRSGRSLASGRVLRVHLDELLATCRQALRRSGLH